MWETLLPTVMGLLDRVLPDQKAAADAKIELMKLAQNGDLAQLNSVVQLATNQADINKVEAANGSLFVAGWRPAIGWVCGAAFAFKFILGPSAVVVMAMAGHPITLPVFDFTEMSTVLMGMLGLGAMRSVEKIKGAA